MTDRRRGDRIDRHVADPRPFLAARPLPPGTVGLVASLTLPVGVGVRDEGEIPDPIAVELEGLLAAWVRERLPIPTTTSACQLETHLIAETAHDLSEELQTLRR